MARKYIAREEHERNFIKLFEKLTYSRTSWQVWEDIMTVIACSISNSIDKVHYEKREKLYMDTIKNLDGDIAAQIFAEIVNALEDNPDQDFLGALYMNLNLGSHWHGQFFTPYSISKMMAKIDMQDAKARIEREGYISVCDMCVGGGAMLIAAANHMRAEGVNYQNHVLFAGQDIDPVVAKMAYIQISLLGCPGYIAVGDALFYPMTGDPLFPQDREGLEYWITPMFMSNVWQYRKIFHQMDHLTKKPKKMFYFYFEKEEEDARRTISA